MTFGATLGKYVMITASASMLNTAVYYKKNLHGSSIQ